MVLQREHPPGCPPHLCDCLPDTDLPGLQEALPYRAKSFGFICCLLRLVGHGLLHQVPHVREMALHWTLPAHVVDCKSEHSVGQ